jgi:hypothetical protein
MKTKSTWALTALTALAAILCFLSTAPTAHAHCDTLGGPVVLAAKKAFDKGDVTPVLKWVRKEDEKEIREAFARTIAVRRQGTEAKELADMYFFETLVRIHRAGEGAPYTGLKPGQAVDPAVLTADKALETGSSDRLVKMLTDTIAKGVAGRFDRAKETMKHADRTVDDGRAFVAAYVEFTHYVERLHADATAQAAHKEVEKEGHGTHHH